MSRLKTLFLVASVVALAGLAVSYAARAARLQNRLDALEKERIEDSKQAAAKQPEGGVKAKSGDEIAAEEASAEAAAVESPFETVKGMSLDDCDRYCKIDMRVSGAVRPEDVLDYIRIRPNPGQISVECETRHECYWDDSTPLVTDISLVTTGILYRTEYTVAVSSNLPFSTAKRLDHDHVASFTRDNAAAVVTFADEGRYLPPVGSGAIQIKTRNVERVDCRLWRVLDENIIQLLAREEGKYRKSFEWRAHRAADAAASVELAAPAAKWVKPVEKVDNQYVTTPMALDRRRGVDGNGTYLVAIRKFDAKRKGRESAASPETEDDYSEYSSDGDFFSGLDDYEWRLVCRTDFGLSARADESGVRVWVTSLSCGAPYAGAVVRLYAANRLLLAEATTDAGGECSLDATSATAENGGAFAIVVSAPDGSDSAFMALRDSMRIDETLPTGARGVYVAPDGAQAFVSSERGIYRPGETILAHAIVRNGRGDAPAPFPVTFELASPAGNVVATRVALTDECGAVACTNFSVSAAQPTGRWQVNVRLPGKNGRILGSRSVKIEEFAPPKVRVSLKSLPKPGDPATNLVVVLAAEQLFGGPAAQLSAEAFVVFKDAAFEPRGYDGWAFGDANRSVKANLNRIPPRFTDENGEAKFVIEYDEAKFGLPRAALEMTVQGAVTEAGGRPAVTRGKCVVHAYPFYIGSDIPRSIELGDGERTFNVALVRPDGSRASGARTLSATLRKFESVYTYCKDNSGAMSWRQTRVSHKVASFAHPTVEVAADGSATVAIPTSVGGEYELTLLDEATRVSHSAEFWISAGGDSEVRAELSNPTAVTLETDRELYYAGERPRLTIKSPFVGTAWLTVMRERVLYTRVFDLTNATSVVELDELDGAWAPNVDVAVSVVQSVAAGRDRIASRAHALAQIPVRTKTSLLYPKVSATVECAPSGGSTLVATVDAKSADAEALAAVVTVVDEGINILTGERVPDPIAHFATTRGARHPLYDLYGQLFPVYGDELRVSGAKTGGGDDAGLMNRVSTVPSRRFKPLSTWTLDVPLTGGVGRVRFDLPEFVGEVRVTAVAYGRRATGAGATQVKVCPKLVAQADAPRFAAPGDSFNLTLALSNRSGGDGAVEWQVGATGAVAVSNGTGRVELRDGESRVISIPAVALGEVGEGDITFVSRGFGETHSSVISLPVRPGATWLGTGEVRLLKPGEKIESANGAPFPATTRRTFAASASPVAELAAAAAYLVDYPYGCLEQTVSQVFPLINAGGFLATLDAAKTSAAADVDSTVAGGIARVVSMVRSSDFTMWPDSNCPPWDREVSLYASHFLVEAHLAGCKVPPASLARVVSFLRRWAQSDNMSVAAYACHTLALSGCFERDRLFSLYDRRGELSPLDRARLARAFVRLGDPERARELALAETADPNDVRTAAFALLAGIDIDPADARLDKLAQFLLRRRDRAAGHWLTTGDNAHALLALGAYYRARNITVAGGKCSVRLSSASTNATLGVERRCEIVGDGTVTLENAGDAPAFVTMRRMEIPAASTLTNASCGISIARRFFDGEGNALDLSKLRRGQLVVVEIELSSDVKREYRDLVIENPLPACFECESRKVVSTFETFSTQRMLGDMLLRCDSRDDRVVAFTRPVELTPSVSEDGAHALFHYAVRVVSAGEFEFPGARVEAMYSPELFAQTESGRIAISE